MRTRDHRRTLRVTDWPLWLMKWASEGVDIVDILDLVDRVGFRIGWFARAFLGFFYTLYF